MVLQGTVQQLARSPEHGAVLSKAAAAAAAASAAAAAVAAATPPLSLELRQLTANFKPCARTEHAIECLDS
jgi:hypothetical protein